MALIHRALEEEADLIHRAPDCMPHEFVICSEFPEEIHYNNYKDSFIKLPYQFIMENYNVFKQVKMYWESTERGRIQLLWGNPDNLKHGAGLVRGNEGLSTKQYFRTGRILCWKRV